MLAAATGSMQMQRQSRSTVAAAAAVMARQLQTSSRRRSCSATHSASDHQSSSIPIARLDGAWHRLAASTTASSAAPRGLSHTAHHAYHSHSHSHSRSSASPAPFARMSSTRPSCAPSVLPVQWAQAARLYTAMAAPAESNAKTPGSAPSDAPASDAPAAAAAAAVNSTVLQDFRELFDMSDIASSGGRGQHAPAAAKPQVLASTSQEDHQQTLLDVPSNTTNNNDRTQVASSSPDPWAGLLASFGHDSVAPDLQQVHRRPEVSPLQAVTFAKSSMQSQFRARERAAADPSTELEYSFSGVHWTFDADMALLRAVREHGTKWSLVARTASALLNPGTTVGLSLLAQSVAQRPASRIDAPVRTDAYITPPIMSSRACQARFARLRGGSQHRDVWTPEQSESLARAVAQHGDSWKAIAKAVNCGRSAAQCFIAYHQLDFAPPTRTPSDVQTGPRIDLPGHLHFLRVSARSFVSQLQAATLVQELNIASRTARVCANLAELREVALKQFAESFADPEAAIVPTLDRSDLPFLIQMWLRRRPNMHHPGLAPLFTKFASGAFELLLDLSILRALIIGGPRQSDEVLRRLIAADSTLSGNVHQAIHALLKSHPRLVRRSTPSSAEQASQALPAEKLRAGLFLTPWIEIKPIQSIDKAAFIRQAIDDFEVEERELEPEAGEAQWRANAMKHFLNCINKNVFAPVPLTSEGVDVLDTLPVEEKKGEANEFVFLPPVTTTAAQSRFLSQMRKHIRTDVVKHVNLQREQLKPSVLDSFPWHQNAISSPNHASAYIRVSGAGELLNVAEAVVRFDARLLPIVSDLTLQLRLVNGAFEIQVLQPKSQRTPSPDLSSLAHVLNVRLKLDGLALAPQKHPFDFGIGKAVPGAAGAPDFALACTLQDLESLKGSIAQAVLSATALNTFQKVDPFMPFEHLSRKAGLEQQEQLIARKQAASEAAALRLVQSPVVEDGKDEQQPSESRDDAMGDLLDFFSQKPASSG
ncbi:hypothetical protein CAOG_07269 [Capsaspora owczarzaki ATCC 30864]|uniref:Myb-like domain-containing protein n=1 Tax=Capsaspora owczarzaki (strain ATCC 30864) TaxID=595528 RepID=A0A0D2WWM8_CAPO3|nr:hypothetical protein CAOG_07269 [Capsaspora owczarzaki ATCC 30864]KJE97400.1 hypothetical protein CAOG_007269 [Capsaspora owczarzaki ATCC 30864]|eukprot:XP_004343128.1 hypothetical protein CAOG_07269 [Capsaspora owczarzaki ATCC 30864]